MRAFLVASVVILMLFVAVVVGTSVSSTGRSAGVELTLEIAPSGFVDAEHVACAVCAVCLESLSENCINENTQEATIAVDTGTGTVLKLPRAAVEVKGWHHEAARSGVEVGAVGVLL